MFRRARQSRTATAIPETTITASAPPQPTTTSIGNDETPIVYAQVVPDVDHVVPQNEVVAVPVGFGDYSASAAVASTSTSHLYRQPPQTTCISTSTSIPPVYSNPCPSISSVDSLPTRTYPSYASRQPPQPLYHSQATAPHGTYNTTSYPATAAAAGMWTGTTSTSHDANDPYSKESYDNSTTTTTSLSSYPTSTTIPQSTRTSPAAAAVSSTPAPLLSLSDRSHQPMTPYVTTNTPGYTPTVSIQTPNGTTYRVREGSRMTPYV